MPISTWIKFSLVIWMALIFLGRVPAQESDAPKPDQKQEVENLLDNLERLQDLQVAVEVRFITITDNFYERIGVDFDFHANIPSSGLFQDYLQPGFGTRVGGSVPLLGGNTPFGLWRSTGRMGFLFNDWDGRDIQLNTSTNNYLVNNAQGYRGELGLGCECLHLPLGPFIFLNGWEVSGNLGGFHANINPFPYSGSLPAVPLAGEPSENSLLGGWNTRVYLGMFLGNNSLIKIHGGYGDSWTKGILNRSSQSGSFEAGASLLIMLTPSPFRQ